MFDTRKESSRLDNVDYAQLLQQGRAERGKVVAGLFKALLSYTRRFIERYLIFL